MRVEIASQADEIPTLHFATPRSEIRCPPNFRPRTTCSVLAHCAVIVRTRADAALDLPVTPPAQHDTRETGDLLLKLVPNPMRHVLQRRIGKTIDLVEVFMIQ